MHSEDKRIHVTFDAVTEDDIVLSLAVAIHHCALPHKAFRAFYEVATKRISAVVTATVRDRLRQVRHNDLRAARVQFTDELQRELARTTRGLGCGNASITFPSIDPS